MTLELTQRLKTVSEIYPKNVEDLNTIYDEIEQHFSHIPEKQQPLFVKRALNATLSLIQFLENTQCNTSLKYTVPLSKVYSEFDKEYSSFIDQQEDTIEDQKSYQDLVLDFERDLAFAQASKELKDVLKEGAKKAFSKARAKLLSDMPTRKDGFKFLSHSVIPIVNRKLNPPKFRDLGVTVEEFEQYFIFKNQILLAINADLLHSHNEGKRKKDQINSYQLAQTILNDTYNTMSIFQDTGIRVKECPGFIFYWVMPTPLITNLSKLVGSIDDWGLNV